MTYPISIGRVALTVNDIGRMTEFYRDALGLTPEGGGEVVTLTAAGRPLVELRSDPAARRARRSEAGLFHTAFLLPTRSDLGAWIRHAADSRLPISGASDHLVSEAIYLDDPEGNGIEVYADRPADQWDHKDGSVVMATEPLDLNALAVSATAPWAGAPEGTTVGHVHLKVGNTDTAESFFTGKLGMDLTTRYPGAGFFSTGGYHHHLAGNIWNSRGAGARTYPSTGLAELELRATPEALAATSERLGGTEAEDPWGTRFTLRAA